MIKKLIGLILVLVLLGLFFVYQIGMGALGTHEGPNDPTPDPRPGGDVARVESAQHDAAASVGAPTTKQILFGDLHVHTTVSFDAFMMSVPLLQGQGAHPQSDACDYARYCSALDFWSINDHASAITPRAWEETVESIRQCNDVASDPNNPDTVAFLGWEWTQMGTTPENHYGHKNVVLAHTDDERIPTRPIGSTAVADAQGAIPSPFALGALAISQQSPRYDDMALYFSERAGVALCDSDTHVRDLPIDCTELAETPGDLFRKLDEWGHDAIVIPHGTTWGMYGPSGTTWDKQLSKAYHDPDRQTLFEIYSGHGNSEEYRDWRSIEQHPDGSVSCPEPRANYLPSCWRAGEIIRERCLEDGVSAAECDARAVDARQLAAESGITGHLTVPGYDATEWLDAGQCRDCAEGAFNYRPGGSAQYVMAISNFDDGKGEDDPLRFRFGFMASSDNHYARPGTGFKEVNRIGSTESRNRLARDNPLAGLVAPPQTERASESVAFDRATSRLAGFQLFEMERQSSFFLTGGLIAAHSEGRDRSSIWSAMLRRETYGTSGPRMLLWFDLLNPPGSRGRTRPMGSAVEMSDPPIFRVRAVGSFEQKPGCPDYVTNNMTPKSIDHVCQGECYNPSDRRRLITRIEVIRVRPQQVRGEPIAGLIEDPWRSFRCDPDPSGCAVTFADPEFGQQGRDTLYYVRAIEEPKLAINAGGFRCERDAEGECVEPLLCGGEGATGDCLSETEPRAWSSPIFVDWPTDGPDRTAQAAPARSPQS
ncbi:MAG: DUF3604 domain-containing protein [Myxococcales bacterium]|nr:DUF3604 domain-containing protein [Myxococcales bacterium]